MELPWQLIADFSAGGLVIAFVISILLGKLIPVNILKEIKADRDLWRETALNREKALETTLYTVKETHRAAELTLQLVSELREDYEKIQRKSTSSKSIRLSESDDKDENQT